MANDSTDSAISGGLLVVLGIIVAVGIMFYFFNFGGASSTPDINIRAEVPAVSAPANP